MKMDTKTVLIANSKKNKGGLLGIFVLLTLVMLSFSTVLTVWINSNVYLEQELDRLGYGEITAWVSGGFRDGALTSQMINTDEVKTVTEQEMIYSEYTMKEQESDSEGQLITYNPSQYAYKIFTDDLSGYKTQSIEINPGDIYVSPAMRSMFGAEIGDTITFPLARNSVSKSFIVRGYFEDPFLGSSMVGMKSFLIGQEDFEQTIKMIDDSGTDALARSGSMLHVFPLESSSATVAELNVLLNEETSLPNYLEFSYSRSVILGFMLMLQNVFTIFLLVFVLILLIVSLIILGNNIASTIDQEYKMMGILKTIGFTSKKIRSIQLLQYAIPIVFGALVGTGFSIIVANMICRMTVTTTGILIPSGLPVFACVLGAVIIILVLLLFIWAKTARIKNISPMKAIRDGAENIEITSHVSGEIHKKGLAFSLAMRQLYTGKKRYISACIVALLLVFFASLVGRVNAWLGPNGEGLMNAFNPADLHIAAQPMGKVEQEDVEAVILAHTQITGSYMLAMPSVSVNGIDYTANVITQPEQFHILEGRTSQTPDEVVLTEFVASDLGVGVNDTVTLTSDLGSAEYFVSGIYQCANDMGANIGMSREAYNRISTEAPNIWCTHYFIEDTSLQPTIMQELESTFGHDVHLHENTWPGLTGILQAMQLLMIFLYVVVAIFILIVTMLTTSKLLVREQKDLAIYKSLGFSSATLRGSFALRFAVVAILGSLLGTIISVLVTDPLVATAMKVVGISNFSSHPTLGALLLPSLIVIVAFAVFAFVASKRIEKITLVALLSE